MSYRKAKAAMVECGKTQEMVAREMTAKGIKMTRTQLSDKLNQKVGMTVTQMKMFAEVVGKNAGDLFF